jgi:predicted glycoside hydrolase/deacetylase ChbG (UPF0249 family)
MTGDDFGLSTETNTGIMRAYLAGALTSTSLMVGGDAAEAAVALARQHPGLAVGLHLTFGDTPPCAPSDQVTMLLSENGRFPADERLLDSALRSAKGRAQIRTEIAAQFKAYNATGLPFDHVNVHRNVHVRPILAWMVFREATRWGVNAMRVPWDSPKAQFSWVDACRLLRVVALRRLGSLYNLTSPHRSIGREWDAAQLVTVLRGLKAGVSEIYFHPVLDMPGHTFANDLPSLLDDQVKAALRDITLCTYQSAKR